MKLESLLYETKIIRNKTIHQASSSKSNMDTDNMFLKICDIILPAKTKEEFNRINVQLQNNAEFRNNFVSLLIFYKT